MTTTVDSARAYARENGGRFLDELLEMLRIPSVGADPAFAADTRRNAEWLAAHLAALGLDKACVMETAGYPVVYAEWLGAGPDKPTVLVYGHYDVVPAVMEDGWDTPPFEPVVKDGKIYCRGATDDKGQLFIHVKALESYLKASGGAPVNVKILLEGEEEVSSPNLVPVGQRAPGPDPGRRVRHQRLVDARGRGAGHHAQPARHDLPRGRSAGAARGLAQRFLGRRDAQSRAGAGRNPRQALQRGRHDRGARLLRRRRVADRRGTRDARQGLADRRAVHGRDRCAGGVGRRKLHDPGARLGAADARHQRPVERLLRPRPEDDHPGACGVQDQLPAGGQPGRSQDLRADQEGDRGCDAADGEGRGAAAHDRQARA